MKATLLLIVIMLATPWAQAGPVPITGGGDWTNLPFTSGGDVGGSGTNGVDTVDFGFRTTESDIEFGFGLGHQQITGFAEIDGVESSVFAISLRGGSGYLSIYDSSGTILLGSVQLEGYFTITSEIDTPEFGGTSIGTQGTFAINPPAPAPEPTPEPATEASLMLGLVALGARYAWPKG